MWFLFVFLLTDIFNFSLQGSTCCHMPQPNKHGQLQAQRPPTWCACAHRPLANLHPLSQPAWSVYYKKRFNLISCGRFPTQTLGITAASLTLQITYFGLFTVIKKPLNFHTVDQQDVAFIACCIWKHFGSLSKKQKQKESGIWLELMRMINFF